MYLLKEITTGYGVPINYHKISAVHAYYDINKVHVDIAGYISKEAYENSGSSFMTHQVELPLNEDLRLESIYLAVLEHPIFVGALIMA